MRAPLCKFWLLTQPCQGGAVTLDQGLAKMVGAAQAMCRQRARASRPCDWWQRGSATVLSPRASVLHTPALLLLRLLLTVKKETGDCKSLARERSCSTAMRRCCGGAAETGSGTNIVGLRSAGATQVPRRH